MSAPIHGALLLYSLLIAWFSGLSWGYWRVSDVVPAFPLRAVVLWCGWLTLMANATPFLDGIRGYPFFNPLLPIIALTQPWQTLPTHQWQQDHGIHWYYLPPVNGSGRTSIAQKLMQQLSSVPVQKGGGAIVSPESTFTYSLCESSKEVGWWRSALPKEGEYVSGVIVEEVGRKSQAALKINSSPIIHTHKKNITIDFFESFNKNSYTHRILNQLIGWKTEDVEPARAQGAPMLVGGRRTQVLLCSEALWARKQNVEQVLILMNESWFPWWVQELFVAALWWRWCTSRVALVGHGRAVAW